MDWTASRRKAKRMPAAVFAAGAFNHRFRCSQRKSREPAEQTATNRHWARGNLVAGDGPIGPGNHWNVLQRVDQIDKVIKRETVVSPERRTLLAGADVRRRCAGGVRADPGGAIGLRAAIAGPNKAKYAPTISLLYSMP